MGELYLRAFLRCQEETEARALAEQLARALEADATVVIETVRPYWKVPQQHEVLLRLEPIVSLEDTYRASLAALGSGWEEQPAKLEAIWATRNGASFLVPNATWAHLEASQ